MDAVGESAIKEDGEDVLSSRSSSSSVSCMVIGGLKTVFDRKENESEILVLIRDDRTDVDLHSN
jgi:hypothetical protein